MTSKDRVAIVTGASRGIGRATALALAAGGVRVAVNHRASHDQAAAVVKEIESLGGVGLVIQADVADPADAERLVGRTIDDLGGLHILVNNAGVGSDGLLHTVGVDEVWRVMRVNFGGVLNCAHAAVGHFMTQGHGSIVNVSSVIAERGWIGEVGYAASKGAVNAFTRTAAVELARFGIRVNAVLPGFTRTEMVDSLLHGDRAKALVRQVPLRSFADVAQIAEVIAFVAGDKASYLTGELVRVDGGFAAQLGIGRSG